MNKSPEHPAWSVYDELITVKANGYYIEGDLRWLKRCNLLSEVLVALATSSAVAGFWFWSLPPGQELWRIVGAVATIIAIAKPLLTLTDRIQSKTELLTDARSLEHEYFTITLLIRQADEYKDEYKQRLLKAVEYRGNFIRAYKDGIADKRRVEQCIARARADYPPESYYIPSK